MKQRGVGLGWESGQCLLILTWPYSENKRPNHHRQQQHCHQHRHHHHHQHVSPLLLPCRSMGPGLWGKGRGCWQNSFLSECFAGLTELCIAFCGNACHAKFLQQFQTGLDNNVFDHILEATWDAIIEPWTAIIASVPQRTMSLELCHHLPSTSLRTCLALVLSLPRLTLFDDRSGLAWRMTTV